MSCYLSYLFLFLGGLAFSGANGFEASQVFIEKSLVLDQWCMIKRGYSLTFHARTVHTTILMMTINFKFGKKPTVGKKSNSDMAGVLRGIGVQGGVKRRKGKIPKHSKFVITLFVFLHFLLPGLFGFCRIRILRSRRHCRIAAIGDFCLDDFSNFLRI